jgi:hypothetical protein
MLTVDQALDLARGAAREVGLPGDIDAAWSTASMVVVMFTPDPPEAIYGNGPYLVDRRTGELTFAGTSRDPAELTAGMTRVGF